MCSVTRNNFRLTICNRFLAVSHVESSYLNTDMCKFESSQEENRAKSADSSKSYRKTRAMVIRSYIASI